MNKKINPKKILRKMSGLPTDEQFLKSLRIHLSDYLKNTPSLAEIKNPEKIFRIRNFNFKMQAIFGLIAILLSGGATAFASQKSLPGEILYPVKLLTENVRLAATINQEKKIESRIALAKKRIEEIQTVISSAQPEQEANTTSDLKSALNNFNLQFEKILSDSQKIKNKGNIDRAYEITAEMKISIDNYRKIIFEKPESKQEIEFEKRGKGVISSINDFEEKIKIEFDDIDNLEKENMKIRGDKKSAEDKINIAENSIKISEKIIDKNKGKVSEQTISSAKRKLIEAKNTIEGAKTDYQNGNYRKAFDSAKQAIKIASSAQLLIKIFSESKFHEEDDLDNKNNGKFKNNDFEKNERRMNDKNKIDILKSISPRSSSSETDDFPKNNERDDSEKSIEDDEND